MAGKFNWDDHPVEAPKSEAPAEFDWNQHPVEPAAQAASSDEEDPIMGALSGQPSAAKFNTPLGLVGETGVNIASAPLAALRGASQLATASAADEAAAVIGATIPALGLASNASSGDDWATRYDKIQKQESGAAKKAFEDEPGAYIGGGLVGGFPMALATGGKGFLAGVGLDTILGAANGFNSGDSLDNRIENAKSGAKWSAGLSAFFRGIPKAIGVADGLVLKGKGKQAIKMSYDDARYLGSEEAQQAFTEEAVQSKRVLEDLTKKAKNTIGQTIDATVAEVPDLKVNMKDIHDKFFKEASETFTDAQPGTQQKILKEAKAIFNKYGVTPEGGEIPAADAVKLKRELGSLFYDRVKGPSLKDLGNIGKRTVGKASEAINIADQTAEGTGGKLSDLNTAYKNLLDIDPDAVKAARIEKSVNKANRSIGEILEENVRIPLKNIPKRAQELIPDLYQYSNKTLPDLANKLDLQTYILNDSDNILKNFVRFAPSSFLGVTSRGAAALGKAKPLINVAAPTAQILGRSALMGQANALGVPPDEQQ